MFQSKPIIDKNNKFQELHQCWKISTVKQDNGLWGMPLQCRKMDKMIITLSEENWLKHSALCIGLA